LYENGKYPFVQTGDVSQSKGRITAYSTMYSEEGLAQSRMWPKGTLCITIAANIAETGILEFDSCFPDSIVGFIPSVLIGEPDYFQYFIKVAKERLESYAPATAQKNINLGILQKLLIPLPPTNEIKRIVAKVEALMGGCDELEAKLRHAQAQRARLTAAVLAGV
jgi:type I restriction enzyme S subunit